MDTDDGRDNETAVVLRQFNRIQFITEVRALAARNVPFRHQGCDPDTGMDCINLPRWAYKNQGLVLPAELEQNFAAYYDFNDGVKLMNIMRRWFLEVEPINAVAGDLYVIYARRNPTHLAVRVTDDEPPMIVEAYRNASMVMGKLIEWRLDPRRVIAAAFRIPDFEQA